MAEMADDLAVVLEQLSVSGPVVFCGLSMGGYIGWQFYCRHRERLGRLIMCDTRAAADSEDVARGRLMMAQKTIASGPADLVEPMISRLFSPITMTTQLDVVAATRDVMLNTDPRSIAAALRGMAERDSAEELLEDLDVPTMFICGKDDSITTLEEMQTLADRTSGASFVAVEDAGHLAPLENPLVVNDAIKAFIA